MKNGKHRYTKHSAIVIFCMSFQQERKVQLWGWYVAAVRQCEHDDWGVSQHLDRCSASGMARSSSEYHHNGAVDLYEPSYRNAIVYPLFFFLFFFFEDF
jgi:hypothetical protein